MHSARLTTPRSFPRSATRAFTMMELLVVLAILGLLAGLAISNVTGIFGGAQASTAQLFVKARVFRVPHKRQMGVQD